MYTEREYTMWLNSLINININKRVALLNFFGSCETLYKSKEDEINESNILTQSEMRRLIDSRDRFDINAEIEKLYKCGGTFIIKSDEEFPRVLKLLEDCPLGLYIIGKLPNSPTPYVSVVGSRRVSSYGATVCQKLCTELARNNITIVSGMAMGIDAIAHKAAIDTGSKTIAVLGSGADVCYPMSNLGIYNDIKYNGCIVSEYALGTKANAYNFPVRNRIIAGLSAATVVIEASERSGSSITANKALDYGRSVMAVPGNITSSLSQGCNKLIAGGCKMVLSSSDILDEIGVKISGKMLQKIEKEAIVIAPDEKIVYDCIDYEPVTVDELVIKLNLSSQTILGLLTLLELKGCVKRLSGQRVVRSL